MKQAEDDRTADFFGDGKRGRGRPSRHDSLTDAQRAKRYRDKVKAQPAEPADDGGARLARVAALETALMNPPECLGVAEVRH